MQYTEDINYPMYMDGAQKDQVFEFTREHEVMWNRKHHDWSKGNHLRDALWNDKARMITVLAVTG